MLVPTFLLDARPKSIWRAATPVVLATALAFLAAGRAIALEHLLLEVSGSFEAVPGTVLQPATASYDVLIPSRGHFRGEVRGSPALFGGPDGNNPNYHFSSQFHSVGDTVLGNFSTTDIEIAPITTERSGMIQSGGTQQAVVVGPQKRSFTWGDFIGGDAQSFTARGFFDPSPVASAGVNQALESGASGSLAGGGNDADSDPLTYTWTRIFGPNLNLSDVHAAQPTISAPVVTAADTTRMQLVVSDGTSESLPDTVDIAIYPTGGNIPPLVDPGPGGMGTFQTQNPLDGSNSYDMDGMVTLYSWTQTSGPRVDLSDPTSPTPTFKQYEPEPSNVTYQFELVVSDGRDLSAPDTTTFVIEGYGNNPVPVGPRETLIYHDVGSVPEVTQISGDPPETVDFPGVAVPGTGRLRTVVQGSPALFGGPDGNNPYLHLSSHGSRWSGRGTHGFRQTNLEVAPVTTNTFFELGAAGSATLTVMGPQALSYTFLDFLYGEAQSFDVDVWFRPESAPPTADAGSYPGISSGEVMQLNGLGSSDPDGDPLSYQWSQTLGPSGSLSNPSSPVPLYKAPEVDQPTTIEFSLVVSDGEASAPADTTLEILPPFPDSDGDDVPDEDDNCAMLPNGPAVGPNDQLDTDGDDYGNVCDCDFDQNLLCNIQDFNVFLPDFVSTVDSGVGTDMDGSLSVGIDDFNLFLPGFVAGVPGPSGVAECIAEGDSRPVVPGALPCCLGLVPIGCDAPVGDTCQLCTGASICADCGDGTCGLSENICNCPDDCLP